MCKPTDANVKDSEPSEYVAKYVPAPEVGDDKLWLVGTHTCFNKMPKLPQTPTTPYEKPAGLSNLSDELFYRFTKDLQLSICGHWTSYWHTLIYLLVMAASASVALYFLVLPPLYLVYFAAASVSFAIILTFGNCNQLKDLQSEIEVRIEEWKPLFGAQGFSVECNVDKKCCRPTGLYIHIKQSPSRRKPKQFSAPVVWSCYGEQEVKYIVLYARMLARRNKMCRVILTSKELSKGIYAKPPALENLSDAVFQSLMKDINKTVRAFMVKKRNICCFLFFVQELIVFLCCTPLGIFLPVTTGLVLFFFLVDQFVIDHFLFPKSGIPECITKWKPCLKEHGFTIGYGVDQPRWYSWKEGLIRIRRRNTSSKV